MSMYTSDISFGERGKLDASLPNINNPFSIPRAVLYPCHHNSKWPECNLCSSDIKFWLPAHRVTHVIRLSPLSIYLPSFYVEVDQNKASAFPTRTLFDYRQAASYSAWGSNLIWRQKVFGERPKSPSLGQLVLSVSPAMQGSRTFLFYISFMFPLASISFV